MIQIIAKGYENDMRVPYDKFKQLLRMKKHLLQFYDKIVVGMLTCIGFLTGCNKPIDIYTPPEYGTPSADYKVKGTVTDSATSQPIKNIRVICNPGFIGYGDTAYYLKYGDTAYTDEQGIYFFDMNHLYDRALKLTAEDIDGEQNGGNFVAKKIEVTFTNDDKVENGSSWYRGRFAKEVNFELSKK